MISLLALAFGLATGQPPAEEAGPLPEEVALTNAKVGGSPKPAGVNDDTPLRRLLLFTKPETIAGWTEAERREADRYLKEQARLRTAAGPKTVAAAVAAGDEEAVIRLGGTMGDLLHASLAAVPDEGTRERIQSSIDSSPPGYLDQSAPQEHMIPQSLAELEAMLRRD